MKESIVRMYETEQQARDAVRALKDEGFPEEMIFLVTPGSGSSADAIASAIMAGYVLRGYARLYAESVQRGRSLVVVRASFGYGQAAIDTMNRFRPVDTGVPAAAEPSVAWDEKAPLSSALGLPVLMRKNPAPLSRIIGLPPLSSGRSVLSPMFGELASSKWSLSSLFGLGLLSRNPAPLSSLFGMKTVSSRRGPMKSRIGFPLLTRRGAGLSSALGLPTLTRVR